MNAGLKEKYRAKIRQVLASHLGVERAVLFGSSTGTYRQGSDVDLVLAGDGLTYSDLGAIGAALVEVTTVPQMVDLVFWNSIGNPVLAEHIKAYGVEFYTQDLGTASNSTPS